MTLKKLTKALLAAAFTLSLSTTGALATPYGAGSAKLSQSEVEASGEVAREALDILAATYEQAHDAVFTSGDAEVALGTSTDAVETLPTSHDGEEALLATVDGIVSDASDPSFDLTIDATHTEVTSEPVIEVLSDGFVSSTSDVTITRHIAEHDVEWIEVVPHEVIVDRSGNVADVIVHDLESQLEDTQNADGQTAPRLLQPSHMEITAVQPTALSATNRGKVADYAEKYALEPNTKYKEYSVDCTNFVSQAMLAGGWKEKSHPWIDYKWDTAWWYGGTPTASWSWTSAEHFYRMSKALDRTTTAKYITDLRRGDLLQYKSKSSANMNHSMVVTKRAGSEVYLSYHTGHTLNKPFSKMRTLDVYWFGHHV